MLLVFGFIIGWTAAATRYEARKRKLPPPREPQPDEPLGRDLET